MPSLTLRVGVYGLSDTNPKRERGNVDLEWPSLTLRVGVYGLSDTDPKRERGVGVLW